MEEFWVSFAYQTEFCFQLALAAVLGGVLGFERERRARPAGLRTFMLVSLGSCLFTILSTVAFPGSDRARVAANILTGIGFIGAGTVFRERVDETTGRIRGLTTAAGLWTSAGIGMAVATGFYWLAVFTTILVFLAFSLVRHLEERLGTTKSKD